jgi:hypothetical protein
LQFIAGPFAMSLSPEALSFAMIVGRKVSLFASPRFTVRKPLQLQGRWSGIRSALGVCRLID